MGGKPRLVNNPYRGRFNQAADGDLCYVELSLAFEQFPQVRQLGSDAQVMYPSLCALGIQLHLHLLE